MPRAGEGGQVLEGEEEQRTSKDEAYENLTLQLGKHFRSNSISRVRGLVANPDCLGEVTSAKAVKLGLYCIPVLRFSQSIPELQMEREGPSLVSIPREASKYIAASFYYYY